MSTSDDPNKTRLIPLAVPFLGGREQEYVADCIASNWVSSVGPYVEKFEQMTAEVAGAKYAVATVNGTSALHIALLVSGVEPGDEVIVSDLTFIASANAVRYAGATPVLLGIEPNYWQMDPNKLDDFCRTQCVSKSTGLHNKASGRRIKAVLPVHILGHPVDIDRIVDIAKRYDLAVVADAAEALGARYKGRPIGAGVDVSCLSFNGNKIITTGGGGILLTDNETLARRAKHLTTQAKSDPDEYIHDEVGFNYRLTNLQAAVGCAQLEELDRHVDTKRRIAAEYQEALTGVPGISTMPEADWARGTFWLYTIRVDHDAYGHDRRALRRQLDAVGIQARPLWQPMHQSPVYRGCQGFGVDLCAELYQQALSLPSSVGLSGEDQQYVVSQIASFARSSAK